MASGRGATGAGGRGAGPRAEDSMIRNPCRGGVVAIGTPLVDGRIVAATAPGTSGRAPTYWGDGDGGPRRRPDRLRRHRAVVRVAGTGQPRAHGGRGPGSPGPA